MRMSQRKILHRYGGNTSTEGSRKKWEVNRHRRKDDGQIRLKEAHKRTRRSTRLNPTRRAFLHNVRLQCLPEQTTKRLLRSQPRNQITREAWGRAARCTRVMQIPWVEMVARSIYNRQRRTRR